jgi:hypothetical protein
MLERAALRTEGNQLPALFLIGALVANHAIFRLGAMQIWIPAVLMAVALIALFIPQLDIPGSARLSLGASNIAIGLIIALPSLASIALGWNREFPFSGDQLFHVKQIYYLSYWWAQPVGSPSVGLLGQTLNLGDFHQVIAHPLRLLWSRATILLVVVAATSLAYRRRPILGVIVATVLFTSWGACEQSVYFRYPGARYVIDQLFAMPAFVIGNVELPGRMSNIAAILAWAFALRPVLLRRWPDALILPAAAFLFWQQDILYYFDSTYLEPWAFVFTFLAVELIVVRGREGVPLACCMVGAAACFKEPVIIALPMVWLIGIIPWRSFADTARASLFGFIGGFPFLLYYFARKNAALTDPTVNRDPDFGISLHMLSDYLTHFFLRLTANFSGTSLIAAILALAAILLAALRFRGLRFRLLCLLAAAATLVLIFAIDANSRYWAGYFRFFVIALPYMSCGLIALGLLLTARQALLVGILILGLQAHSAFTAVTRSAGLGMDRNFVEFFDSPLVFPIRYLLREARAANYIVHRATVLANQPDDTVRVIPGIDVSFGQLGELYCTCTGEHPNVMALFVQYNNLAAPFADRSPTGEEIGPFRDRDRLWRKNRAQRPACLAEMKRTCAHVIERNEHGEIVGALGTR